MESRLVQSAERPAWRRYGVALAAPVAALLLRFPLAPILGDKNPYHTFWLATAVSAAFGGFGPGALTTLFSALLAMFFVVPGRALAFTDTTELSGFLVFIGLGAFISFLGGRMIDSRLHENALRLLFQQTLISIGDAVISMDEEKLVRLMNPVAEKLTGWTQSEARGKPIEKIFRIVREGTDTPAEIPIDRILTTGKVVGLANNSDLITKSGGKRIPIDDSGAPIKDEAGRIVGAVLVFRDISDRKRDEAERYRLTEDIKHFTYAATHDVREPLRMITVNAQMLRRKLGGNLDQQGHKYLSNVVNGAARIGRLVDGLLAFSHLAESETVQPVATDTEAALKEAIDSLQITIQETAAEISFDALPVVLANPVHVSQVFQNLLANALKYHRPGVVPFIRITAAHGDTAGEWVFTVQDNGIGIDPAHYNRIFTPFSRLHGLEIAGVGLGLATCKRIVERYGGRIWVESKQSEGSIFYFSLQAAQEVKHAGV